MYEQQSVLPGKKVYPWLLQPVSFTKHWFVSSVQGPDTEAGKRNTVLRIPKIVPAIINNNKKKQL